jgi:hypothetical protein
MLSVFYKIQSTLRAIVPRGVRVMVFVSNPFEPDTLFQQQKEYPENAAHY